MTVSVNGGQEVFEFPCGRWLDKDKDDGQLSRDLIVKGGADSGLNLYEVVVHTGDRKNAGTNAKG